MTSTLIDTNVLVDVLERREPHVHWVHKQFVALARNGSLTINQIIHGEASVPYDDSTAFDALIGAGDLVRKEVLPWEAGFLAGKAFRAYRQRGGPKPNVLPDFLIGAHALVKGYAVLTRDPARFRMYFPSVTVIAPDSHP